MIAVGGEILFIEGDKTGKGTTWALLSNMV